MKRLMIFTFLFIGAVTFAQEKTASLTWLTNLEKAKKISKKEQKPILVYFTGSDWCTPCRMLKTDFFNSSEFAERATDLVLVMIDKPRRIDIISKKQMEYNDKIIAKYNTAKAFPKLLMLNYKGKILGDISGYSYYYRDATNHFAFVDEQIASYN